LGDAEEIEAVNLVCGELGPDLRPEKAVRNSKMSSERFGALEATGELRRGNRDTID
jgi:hypothetical protein